MFLVVMWFIFGVLPVSLLVYFILKFIERVAENRREIELEEEEKNRYQEHQKRIEEFYEKARKQKESLKEKYKNLSPEEIILNKKIESEKVYNENSTIGIDSEEGDYHIYEDWQYMLSPSEVKIFLLTELYNYGEEEAEELIETAQRIEKKEKLKSIKRKIKQKAREKYGNIPSDSREPIPEEVKNQVWNRDGGKCVKCGSKEKLEFDHIIPISKGGANTTRNIQLLCEKCNREKSNNIG